MPSYRGLPNDSGSARQEIDPAFLGDVSLPPPPAGPWVLAGAGRTGTGLTADAGKAALIERVVGDIVLPDVFPDLRGRPVSQWVELEDAAVSPIDFDLTDLGTRRRLAASLAGYPGGRGRQGSLKRLDFANLTAPQPEGDVSVERVDSLGQYECLQLGGVRVVDLYRNLVPIPHELHQLVTLVVQAAGVDRDHSDGRVQAPGHVENCHTLDLQAGRNHQTLAELPDCPAQDLFGWRLLEPARNGTDAMRFDLGLLILMHSGTPRTFVNETR